MNKNQHMGVTEYENKYGFIIKDDAVEKFEWIIKILPDPWKTEFVEDVLVYKNSYNFRVLNKVFMYYIDDIYNELPKETKDEIDDKYIMISL